MRRIITKSVLIFLVLIPNAICTGNVPEPLLHNAPVFNTSALRLVLLEGAREFDISAISPLRFPVATINSTTFTVVLTNLVFTGTEDLTVLEKIDTNNDGTIIELSFPHLKLESADFADGQIENFTFKDNANSTVDFYDVILTFTLDPKIPENNVAIDVKLSDLQFSRITLFVENLYKANPERNVALNEMLARNIDQLKGPYRLVLVNSVGKVLSDYIRKYVSFLHE